jgi:ABC-type sulfate transport system substrate-binding protein
VSLNSITEERNVETLQLRFAYGAASAREIRAVMDELIADLTTSATNAGHPDLDEFGLNPAEIQLDVTEDRHGAEPVATMIVIEIAINASTHIAVKVWQKLVWPRIKQRLGSDALGPPSDPPVE